MGGAFPYDWLVYWYEHKYKVWMWCYVACMPKIHTVSLHFYNIIKMSINVFQSVNWCLFHTGQMAIKNANTILKINRNSVFECHLSPNWRQMATKNTVSFYFWSAFVDCRLRFWLPPIRCVFELQKFSSTYLLSCQHLSHDMILPTEWVSVKRRLRSDWASTQSDQSLCFVLSGL